MHQQAITTRVAALERAFLQVHDVVGARVLVDEPDEIRTASREAAGRKAGVIVELFDELQDPRASFAAHIGFAVEHPRNSLDRYARSLRDIMDGYTAHKRGPPEDAKLSCCQTALS